ncbi:hypothetical protein ACA910_014978 [Epithemia clementina (nom. ined.)]
MGQVKDIYMPYATAGDKFVGCCLCLLPLLQAEFGFSPPHFGELVNDDFAKEMVSAQYPIIYHVDEFGKLCQMCLASTLFHHAFVMDFPSNHVAHATSQASRHAPTLNFFSENADAVKRTMSCADHQHHFSGIPPHMSVLHDLMVVHEKQRLLVDRFIDKMGTLLDK